MISDADCDGGELGAEEPSPGDAAELAEAVSRTGGLPSVGRWVGGGVAPVVERGAGGAIGPDVGGGGGTVGGGSVGGRVGATVGAGVGAWITTSRGSTAESVWVFTPLAEPLDATKE